LVIDLRNNFGGDAASGNKLLSFFVEEKHYFNIEKKKGKIFKYSTAGSRFGGVLNLFLGHFAASRRMTFNRRKTKSHLKPNTRNKFEGRVFVLTNGFTASTASNSASLFKYKTKATLIGEETGGGENNLNAYYTAVVKLPYSKIKIKIPQYSIDLNLMKNTGSGVKPNIEMDYTIKDIRIKKDLEMEKVINLVKQKNKT